MTFPVVVALAVVGWVFVFVLIAAVSKAAKDGQAMLDQAHAYRNDRDRIERHLKKAAEAWNHELSTYQEQMWQAGEMLRHQEEGP